MGFCLGDGLAHVIREVFRQVIRKVFRQVIRQVFRQVIREVFRKVGCLKKCICKSSRFGISGSTFWSWNTGMQFGSANTATSYHFAAGILRGISRCISRGMSASISRRISRNMLAGNSGGISRGIWGGWMPEKMHVQK